MEIGIGVDGSLGLSFDEERQIADESLALLDTQPRSQMA